MRADTDVPHFADIDIHAVKYSFSLLFIGTLQIIVKIREVFKKGSREQGKVSALQLTPCLPLSTNNDIIIPRSVKSTKGR
jgi:hypothetical protein